MRLQSLAEALKRRVEEERRESIEQAKKEAAEIVRAARDEANRVVREAKKEAEMFMADEEREKNAWVKLEIKRIMNEGREDVIKQMMFSAYKKLPMMRETKAYKDFMKKALKKTMSEFEENRLVLHIKNGDEVFLPQKNDDGINKKIRVKKDIEGAGGFILETRDGKIRCDLTLESLFEQYKDELRRLLYVRCFR